MRINRGIDTSDNLIKQVNTIENTKNGSVAIRADNDMHLSTITKEYTGNQTNVTLLTPEEGKKLCIREIETDVNGNAGTIEIDFLTSEKKVHRHYSQGAGLKTSGTSGHIIGDTDEPLTLNATALGSSKLFLRISYIEHE